MKLKSFLLNAGKLQERQEVSALLEIDTGPATEIWYDIADAEPDELRRSLSALKLHPLMLNYCVSGLNASDNAALQEPHRKAYIQDLVSEVEIAQCGIYRLEARVKDLFDSYQMAASTRVEKRLRILTIISAITLPFGLIAGLLGMNVGGLPGIQDPYGFIIVVSLMFAIAIVELWYFRRKGWFD